MKPHYALFGGAILLCIASALCSQTVREVYHQARLGALVDIGVAVAFLYVGLDLLLAPRTTPFNRINQWFHPREQPYDVSTPLMGALSICVALGMGWSSLYYLLGQTP